MPLPRIEPILWPGHTMPTKPVYWCIWILNEKKKPYHSRLTNDKLLTPQQAARQCYGIDVTENMRFFNCTSTIVGCRRTMSQLRKVWEKEAK